jgi:hypothetical protein
MENEEEEEEELSMVEVGSDAQSNVYLTQFVYLTCT